MDKKNFKVAVSAAVGVTVLTGVFCLTMVSIDYMASKLRKSLAGKN